MLEREIGDSLNQKSEMDIYKRGLKVEIEELDKLVEESIAKRAKILEIDDSSERLRKKCLLSVCISNACEKRKGVAYNVAMVTKQMTQLDAKVDRLMKRHAQAERLQKRYKFY